MSTQHPITPPPELVGQWLKEWGNTWSDERGNSYIFTAVKAAQWGADQELEACCEWMRSQNLVSFNDRIASLRAARRPKPPSLKEQALAALMRYTTGETILTQNSADTIRRALEALPE